MRTAATASHESEGVAEAEHRVVAGAASGPLLPGECEVVVVMFSAPK